MEDPKPTLVTQAHQLHSSQNRTLPPAHFPSFLPTLLNLPLPRWFEKILFLNITTGQMLLLVVYGGVVGVSTLFYSNPKADASRSAIIALAQVPFVVALGCKNSPVVTLLGRGREKFNFVSAPFFLNPFKPES